MLPANAEDRARPTGAAARRLLRGALPAALGLTLAAAQTPDAPSLRAALDELAQPQPDDGQQLTPRTLCNAPRCAFALPDERAEQRSGTGRILLGAAAGLATGAALADAGPRRAALTPLRFWDGALIGVGAFFVEGRDLLPRRAPPALGEGRWSDCDAARETLGTLDVFFRDRLAGRSAGSRAQLARALRRRALAAELSDATLGATLALPIGFALRAGSAQPWREALLYVETAALAGGLTSLVKRHAHRPRPFAQRCEPPSAEALDEEDAQQSFFSGHASLSFALAVSGWRLARWRGDRGAGALQGASLALATLTALLRVAADKHYFSDVAVGAVVGLGSGLLVTQLHRPERATTARPAPDALAARAPGPAFAPGAGLSLGLPRGARLQAGFTFGGASLAISF